MVYVAGQNGWLYAIDDYGDISWTHKTDAPIYSTPVVGYDGKIYVCSEDGLIYALDADGSELWTFATKGPAKLNGAIFATPVIDRNGTVYIGGLYEPNLYALDANSGSVQMGLQLRSRRAEQGPDMWRHRLSAPTEPYIKRLSATRIFTRLTPARAISSGQLLCGWLMI